jgi:hypothetical protein
MWAGYGRRCARRLVPRCARALADAVRLGCRRTSRPVSGLVHRDRRGATCRRCRTALRLRLVCRQAARASRGWRSTPQSSTSQDPARASRGAAAGCATGSRRKPAACRRHQLPPFGTRPCRGRHQARQPPSARYHTSVATASVDQRATGRRGERLRRGQCDGIDRGRAHRADRTDGRVLDGSHQRPSSRAPWWITGTARQPPANRPALSG